MVVSGRRPSGTRVRAGQDRKVPSGQGLVPGNRARQACCGFSGTSEYARATTASLSPDGLSGHRELECRSGRQRRRSGFRRESLPPRWPSGAPFLSTGSENGSAEGSQPVSSDMALRTGSVSRDRRLPSVASLCLTGVHGSTAPLAARGTKQLPRQGDCAKRRTTRLHAPRGKRCRDIRVMCPVGGDVAGTHPSAAGSVVARVSAGRWMVWKRPLLRP